VAPLVVLGALAALLATPTPSVRSVAHSVAGKPFCLVDAHIPDEAYAVEQFMRTHNFSPPPGLKGGKPYTDDNHALPALLRPYKEYDVYPAVPGSGRPSPRVVLSDRVPYASWYSPHHYSYFLLMFPPGCLVDPTRWIPRARLPGGGT
jgi:hypothetical protein